MDTAPLKTMTATFVALALFAGFEASAHHQFLKEAYPAAKSHSSDVNQVKLMFDGSADALFSTMKLMKADGSVVAEVTQPKASREMVMSTSRLSPGSYLVEYRVLATDGEVVKAITISRSMRDPTSPRGV